MLRDASRARRRYAAAGADRRQPRARLRGRGRHAEPVGVLRAMGDTTNTAARIMKQGRRRCAVCAPDGDRALRTLFAVEPAGPFPMKGKTEPVLVPRSARETGTRGARSRVACRWSVATPEVTRPRRPRGGARRRRGVVTVSAATGLGKSRVISVPCAGSRRPSSRCAPEPYGMTSSYRMLRDPVRQAFGVERAASLRRCHARCSRRSSG